MPSASADWAVTLPEVSEYDHWLALARWTPLAILVDLDGTLIPFTPTPEGARPSPELVSTDRRSRCLAWNDGGRDERPPSGSARGAFRGRRRSAARRGARRMRRDAGAWQPWAEASQEEVEDLAEELRGLATRHPGARVERKTWSVAFHFRAIAPERREGVVVEVENRVAAWLTGHSRFVDVRASEVLEVRPARLRKGSAIAWLRERAGAGARLLALGDDVTDEDMFRSLAAEDESVLDRQRSRVARPRRAGDSTARGNGATPALDRWPCEPDSADRHRAVRATTAYRDAADRSRLALCLPFAGRLQPLARAALCGRSGDTRKRNVGGLVSALEPALGLAEAFWLGWSGRTRPDVDADVLRSRRLRRAGAGVDRLHRRVPWHYYNGLLQRRSVAATPFLPEPRTLSDQDWPAYRAGQRGLRERGCSSGRSRGRGVGPRLSLFLLGQRLRGRGHRGPIGLFLHIRFPRLDLFLMIPWADELLESMLAFDLLGFHTPGHVENFRRCVAALPGTFVGRRRDRVPRPAHAHRRVPHRDHPRGLPGACRDASTAERGGELDALDRAESARARRRSPRLHEGHPGAADAFGRLLELYPEWRGKVSLVQISVPSRGDVPGLRRAAPARRDRRRAHQRRVRRGDWVPIRYLYRSYGRNQLSQLYRAAAVGYVTPLRDGMNLVAKEWVAAQDPDESGSRCVLSRFAGAAVELTRRHPHEPVARGRPGARPRSRAAHGARGATERHEKLLAAVSRTTAVTWAEDFLSALFAAGAPN